jgi:hypothetical protein
VVSFADAAFGGLRWRDAAAYLPAQVAGCILGAVLANLMFAQAAVSISTKHRATPAHFLSEVIATLGLILVIFALARSGRSRSAPAAVGAYIGAAYFFTSSTSFANPAITVGRMFSDTFAGIAPDSVLSFIGAQIIGGALAVAVVKTLYPISLRTRRPVMVPHESKPSCDGRPAAAPRVPEAVDRRSRAGRGCRDHDGLRRGLPIYPGKRYEDWELADPAKLDLQGVRPSARSDQDTRRSAPGGLVPRALGLGLIASQWH